MCTKVAFLFQRAKSTMRYALYLYRCLFSVERNNKQTNSSFLLLGILQNNAYLCSPKISQSYKIETID